VRDAAVAERMSIVVDAAAAYVDAHMRSLIVDTSGNLAIPITGTDTPLPANLKSVQEAGFLPDGFGDRNTFGQREWLLVRRVGTGPSVKLEFLVVTSGGREIENGSLQWIASKMGATGGFVIGSTGATGPYSAGRVYGAFGGWSYAVANWNVGGLSPEPGHIAASLAFTERLAFAPAPYLYRYQVPGYPEANQMFTDINMSGNNINNVGNLNAGSVDVTDTLAVGGLATFGADVTADGLVTARDFIISSMGGEKVSNGIYNAGIYNSGDSVAAPTCPEGSSPQIFVVPVAYSANETGSSLVAVHASAEGTGPWTVQLRVRANNEWVTPNSTYGKVAVFTKCTG
jgi:hypothetical protein